jgi:hypothetical protein
MKRKVAVVGSGFAAFGVVVALGNRDDVELHVLDIGLTRAGNPLADRPVANAKKCDGSYYCYGVNDPCFPVRLESERMCSSHALGGHSTVYSGAILYPKDQDLAGWPEGSIPLAEDYAAVLARLPLLHEPDALDAVFPLVPDQACLAAEIPAGCTTSVVGMSRIAASMSPSGAGPDSRAHPHSLRADFSSLAAAGVLRYMRNCYVSHAQISEGRVELVYSVDGKRGSATFDAVFLGAGCVNTTVIVDRSLGTRGTRDYTIRAPHGAIHAFLRLPRRNTPAARLRQRSGLPEIFLEVHSPHTDDAWAHTQLTGINEQIIDAICSRLPRFFHPCVKAFRHVVYFALSSKVSGDREAATLRSTLVSDGAGGMAQSASIIEHSSPRYPKLVKAVRGAVRRHWRTLWMVPFPFGEQLADFFRRNRLGGWHFGGSLPMRAQPDRVADCRASGEVAGLAGVYVVDSAAFPTVPSSTVALLTAAHGHRVARSWISAPLPVRS